jgi:cellulose synthase/poly-beta-1,6-N-acetylglucosamine synthase-like glycosyltransferase
MIYYITFCLVFNLLYVLLMTKYIVFWKQSPVFERSALVTEGGVRIAVLIAARNEATKIVACLSSIANNDYPKSLYQVCIIDDDSEDNTAEVVLNWINQNSLHTNFQLISNNGIGKKAAIETGIHHIDSDLVITTDADCVVLPRWLSLFAALYAQKNAKFIAAPVEFFPKNSLFTRFQSLDFLGMMGITAAGIKGRFLYMCNGANLAYPLAVFHEVEGFKDINHVASGDDMLLMHKIVQRYPHDIHFLKNTQASVFTYAKDTLDSFLGQRIRWASKSSSYTEYYTIIQLGISYLCCINILHSLLLVPFGKPFIYIFLIQFLLKSIIDYFFLSDVTRFFKKEKLMQLNNFFISQIAHILYIAFVGTASVFQPKYVWKGRKVR